MPAVASVALITNLLLVDPFPRDCSQILLSRMGWLKLSQIGATLIVMPAYVSVMLPINHIHWNLQ
jgi:hypothetical protein